MFFTIELLDPSDQQIIIDTVVDFCFKASEFASTNASCSTKSNQSSAMKMFVEPISPILQLPKEQSVVDSPSFTSPTRFENKTVSSSKMENSAKQVKKTTRNKSKKSEDLRPSQPKKPRKGRIGEKDENGDEKKDGECFTSTSTLSTRVLNSPPTFLSLDSFTPRNQNPSEPCESKFIGSDNDHSPLSPGFVYIKNKVMEEIERLPSAYEGFSFENGDLIDAAIKFWKSREARQRFPCLTKVADKYLCAVASSCPSESCFSFLSHVMNYKRNRSKASLVSSLCKLWNEFRDPNTRITLKLVSELASLSTENIILLRKLEYFTKFGMRERVILTHPRRIGEYSLKKRAANSQVGVEENKMLSQEIEDNKLAEAKIISSQDMLDEDASLFAQDEKKEFERNDFHETDEDQPSNECNSDEYDKATSKTKCTRSTTVISSYIEIDARNCVLRPTSPTNVEECQVSKEEYDKLFQNVLQNDGFVSTIK